MKNKGMHASISEKESLYDWSSFFNVLKQARVSTRKKVGRLLSALLFFGPSFKFLCSGKHFCPIGKPSPKNYPLRDFISSLICFPSDTTLCYIQTFQINKFLKLNSAPCNSPWLWNILPKKPSITFQVDSFDFNSRNINSTSYNRYRFAEWARSHRSQIGKICRQDLKEFCFRNHLLIEMLYSNVSTTPSPRTNSRSPCADYCSLPVIGI